MQTEEGGPEEDGQGMRARADLLTSIVLIVVGLFLFYESYSMPRLEARNIHPLTIPGLVPMILSFALTLLGVLLAYRSWRIHAPNGWSELFALLGSMQAARVAAGMGLVLIFVFGLIGNMPFWAASMIFIVAMVLTMEVVLTREPVPFVRSVFWAVATAVVCGGGIYYLFAVIFLVRLP